MWWSTIWSPGTVEAGGEDPFGHRHAHGVPEALPERSRGGLHARGEALLRMAGGPRPPLPKAHQLLEREVVAGQCSKAYRSIEA